MKLHHYFGLILIFSVVFSCKHLPENPEQEMETTQNQPFSSECDEDSVYFEQQILPLFQSSCAISDCHDAAGSQDGIILDSYENIIQTGDIEGGDLDAGDIIEVINETDPDDVMPPDPYEPLSLDEVSLIETWITQGAQNNSCTSLLCDTLEVTFSGDIMPLVATFCEGCHSGANPSAGIALTNHSEISTAGESGLLYGTVAWLNGYEPMPQNGDQLSECQIRMIEIWIENGMPND